MLFRPAKTWLRTALLLVLLLAQTLAFAHELTHDRADSETCVTCTVAQQLDAGAVETANDALYPAAPGWRATRHVSLTAAAESPPYFGRAPPHFST